MFFTEARPFTSSIALVDEGCRWLEELGRPANEREMTDDYEAVSEARLFFEAALSGFHSVAYEAHPPGRGAYAEVIRSTVMADAERGLREVVGRVLAKDIEVATIDAAYIKQVRGWLEGSFHNAVAAEQAASQTEDMVA